jgi:hypothetical protein
MLDGTAPRTPVIRLLSGPNPDEKHLVARHLVLVHDPSISDRYAPDVRVVTKISRLTSSARNASRVAGWPIFALNASSALRA